MINGILLLNKTPGGTSHDMVAQVRHLLDQKQVGHAGALDPLAEGLLVILLGGATKLSDYLLINDKRYHFVFCLGKETDTLDKDGKVISESTKLPSAKEIEQVITKAQGTLPLPVPLVSSVKVKGKKLYEYKRENKPITPPIREMSFYDLKRIDIKEKEVEVELSCKKGSYIRSWVSFVGKELKAGAYLQKLIRLWSHPFELKQALSLTELKEKLKNEEISALAGDVSGQRLKALLKEAFIPFSQSLPHIPAVKATPEDEKQARHGHLSASLKNNLLEEQKSSNKEKQARLVRLISADEQKMIALLELKPFAPTKFLRVFVLK